MTYDPHVPASLLNIQIWFSQILTHPLRVIGEYDLPEFDAATLQTINEELTPGPHLTSAQRIGIYNQQFWYRMYILIQAEYPALLTLFGYEEFNRLIIEPYLLRHFPSNWALHHLGRALPQWIEEEYEDEDKHLIYQIALLDDLYERLLFAHPHLPLKDLTATIYLQPTLRAIHLEGDLIAFRNELLTKEVEDWQEFPKIDWSKPRYFTLEAKEGEIHHEEISHPEFILLEAFQTGATLEQACDLLPENPEIANQITQWFQKWAERNWLTGEMGRDFRV